MHTYGILNIYQYVKSNIEIFSLNFEAPNTARVNSERNFIKAMTSKIYNEQLMIKNKMKKLDKTVDTIIK